MDINNLPLFSNLQRDIEEQFHPEAHIVLYPGDVNESLDTIPKETVNLIVTSPPYNIGKAYETRVEIEQYLERQAEIIGSEKEEDYIRLARERIASFLNGTLLLDL